MDEYTQKTKIWLDNRFKKYDDDGIYFAHQPIYGFRKNHSELGIIGRYIITYRIMKMLSHLKFNTLLDVGGAEGYKAYVARIIFGVDIKNSDLSEEACKRAKEIFNIDSDPVDIHNLPYEDNQFDVVLCSETLEHVTNFHKAVYELLRVARKAVVITIPHQTKELVENIIKNQIPHGHIHSFTPKSFDFLKANNYTIIYKKVFNWYLCLLNSLIDGTPMKNKVKKLEKIIAFIYNPLLPVLKKIIGRKVAGFLIRIDGIICKLIPLFLHFLIVILKNEEKLAHKPIQKVSPYRVMNIKVPYHYLSKNNKIEPLVLL
ncbi:MAG: class I SAM-dependent methyltransferase [Candidatus Hodarchaeota archaeon]